MPNSRFHRDRQRRRHKSNCAAWAAFGCSRMRAPWITVSFISFRRGNPGVQAGKGSAAFLLLIFLSLHYFRTLKADAFQPIILDRSADPALQAAAFWLSCRAAPFSAIEIVEESFQTGFLITSERNRPQCYPVVRYFHFSRSAAHLLFWYAALFLLDLNLFLIGPMYTNTIQKAIKRLPFSQSFPGASFFIIGLVLQNAGSYTQLPMFCNMI